MVCGEDENFVVFLLHGEFRITDEHGRLLTTLRAPRIVGEAGFVRGRLRTSDVYAKVRSSYLLFARLLFLCLLIDSFVCSQRGLVREVCELRGDCPDHRRRAHARGGGRWHCEVLARDAGAQGVTQRADAAGGCQRRRAAAPHVAGCSRLCFSP